MEQKLSEQLKHCLDGNGCGKCVHAEEKTILSCRSLLQSAYEKIKYFEDLEEQGLLLKLPCKVGTKVYCIMTSLKGTHPMIFTQNFDYSMVECFGKTVFLAQTGAEDALKGMERED